MNAISKNPKVWLDLPVHFARLPEFMEKMTDWHPRDVFDAIENFPELESNVLMWKHIVTSKENNLWDIFHSCASETICSNSELMLSACRRYPELARHIELTLKQDGEFVETLLEHRPEALFKFPTSTQLAFRDLISDTLAALPQDYKMSAYHDFNIDNVPSDFFRDATYRRAWIEGGGSYVPEVFERFDDDKEMFLLFAKNHWRSVEKASKTLLNDKDFMLKAVDTEPRIYDYASESLKCELDMRVAGYWCTERYSIRLGGSLAFRDRERLGLLEWITDVQEVRDYTTSMLRNSEAFGIFLCGCSQPADPSIPPTFLNQGPEASCKLLIAEFVGVPTGAKLARFRRVALMQIPEDDSSLHALAGYSVVQF